MTDMFDTEKFAADLRAALARYRVAHSDLARSLGINPATLSRICHGHSRPSIETHTRISRWLAEVESK